MPRVLIVDDSRYQRYLIIQALEGLFTPTEAANGREAIDLFRTATERDEGFDLIVMDILMPVLSGHDALAGIRDLETARGVAAENRTPAVMLSSLDDPANMLRAQFESGAQAYVTKPFTAQTLREALTSLGLAENPLSDDVADEEFPCKAF